MSTNRKGVNGERKDKLTCETNSENRKENERGAYGICVWELNYTELFIITVRRISFSNVL
jgi:hypothetical protein